MHLHDVVDLLSKPLQQEQAWAILFRSSSLLKRIWRQRQRDDQPIFPIEPQFIQLATDGSIDIQWEGESLAVAANRDEVVSSLALSVYHALDYGLANDEERVLDADLERLLVAMAGCGDESDGDTTTGIDFDEITQACVKRLPLPEEAGTHYGYMCRLLVNEAKKVCWKRKGDVSVAQTYELQGNRKAYDVLPDVVPNEWMVLWMNVVEQLKKGVALKEIQIVRDMTWRKFELTPYEMLMDTIRNPPQLNTTQELLKVKAQKLGHHPHLKPVESRVLGPKIINDETPMDMLLKEIRSQPELKSVSKRMRSEPLLNGCSLLAAELGASSVRHSSSSPVRGLLSPVSNERKRLKVKPFAQLLRDMEKQDSIEMHDASSDGDVNRQAPPRPIPTPPSNITVDEGRESPAMQNRRSLCIDPPVVKQKKLAEGKDNVNEITLDEVRHIRDVLDRATMESLETENEDVFKMIRSGKMCNVCQDVRFSLLEKSKFCGICNKRVCFKCLTKISLPSHHIKNFKSKMLQRSKSFSFGRLGSFRRKSSYVPGNSTNGHEDMEICVGCRNVLGGLGGKKQGQSPKLSDKGKVAVAENHNSPLKSTLYRVRHLDSSREIFV